MRSRGWLLGGRVGAPQLRGERMRQGGLGPGGRREGDQSRSAGKGCWPGGSLVTSVGVGGARGQPPWAGLCPPDAQPGVWGSGVVRGG